MKEGGLGNLIQRLEGRRKDRHDQTLSDTSPVPAGGDSALVRQIAGVVHELVTTHALARSPEQIRAITDGDVRRRAELIKKWVKETYNSSVKGNEKYSHWSHGEFETDLLASFDKGFRYFAQVSSINDIGRLRKPPRTFIRNGRRMTEPDRRKPLEIVIDEYSQNGDDPIQNYAVELLSVFGIMFFKLLKSGLQRGTPKGDLLKMLEHTYGISENLFDYEHTPSPPYSLDVRTVTHVCRQYPAQALKRLEAYARLGERLISTYWGDPTPGVQTEANRQWVTSPAMIKNFILQYPDNVEHGFAIIDSSLANIARDFPKIPKDVIIATCAKLGNGYEEELRNIDTNVEEALDLYPCTDLSCDAKAARNGEHVFRFLKVESRLYQLISRRRTGYVGVLRSAEEKYTQTLERAQEKKVAFSYRGKRRIMQLLLSGKETSISRIIERETSRAQKEERMFEKVLDIIEKKDPVWGFDYALWGAGSTLPEKLESGEERITTLLRSYYGDNYVEGLLQHQSNTLSQYIDSGFDPKSRETDQLKECLLFSPNAVKAYYEKLSIHSRLPWPKKSGDDEEVDEIQYDDSWETDLEGENGSDI